MTNFYCPRCHFDTSTPDYKRIHLVLCGFCEHDDTAHRLGCCDDCVSVNAIHDLAPKSEMVSIAVCPVCHEHLDLV